MDHTTPISKQQRAELVAYLDGELDPPAAAQVERTLADNPELRHEADLLEQTWGLLDELPKATASDEFTTRTMTTIQLGVIGEARSSQSWLTRNRRGIVTAGWLCGLLLMGVTGFLATNHWMGSKWDTLVEDLPVIENVDAYSDVQDIQFLKLLEQSELFDEDPPVDSD